MNSIVLRIFSWLLFWKEDIIIVFTFRNHFSLWSSLTYNSFHWFFISAIFVCEEFRCYWVSLMDRSFYIWLLHTLLYFLNLTCGIVPFVMRISQFTSLVSDHFIFLSSISHSVIRTSGIAWSLCEFLSLRVRLWRFV